MIPEPLEVVGVDRFHRRSGMVLKARVVVTTPGDQWKVGREFNRRLKLRLRRRRVEIGYPTVHEDRELGGQARPGGEPHGRRPGVGAEDGRYPEPTL